MYSFLSTIYSLCKLDSFKKSSIHCDKCLEEDEHLNATHFCNDCNKNLCNLHLLVHNKENNNHNLNELLNCQSENNQHCKEHNDHIIEFYCKDCKKLICVRCAALLHKLHNYIDINEIVKEEEENIKKLINNLNLKKEVILQRNNDIDETIVKLNEQY
ncbi:hypothetical protein ABK040_015974 [Willaertia magna]